MAAPTQHVLGIDPKMYRHFTALTLVISLSIALFANGDQRPVLGQQNMLKRAKPETKSHGPRSEMDVLNGTPEDPSPVKGGNAPPPPPSAEDGPISADPADDGQFTPRTNHFSYRRPPPRVDPAMLAKMTPDQRAAYLKALDLRERQAELNQGSGGGGSAGGAAGGIGPSGPSQQQINRLVSASRARSGGGD